MVEKNPNGWWFVNIEDQQGWVPATYLDPVDKLAAPTDEKPVKTPHGKSYVSSNAYKAAQADEVSFEKGVVIQVSENAYLSTPTTTTADQSDCW